MASLSFNKDNRIDDFTFVLVRKDNYKIGAIQGRNVDYKRNFNGPDELSLKVYKDLDSGYNKYWDRLNDYNDLYVPQLGKDGYFEIEVTLNEDNEGVYKTITATSRCESELSHTKIYTYEINSDDEMIYDEEWDENNVTRLYRDPTQAETELANVQAAFDNMSPDDDGYKDAKDALEAAQKNLYNTKHRSIMHRLLDKLPNYSIGHVDQTLVELKDWYQFTWDDTSVYDIMTGDLADNYHVLFKFDSENRIISLYDLYTVCLNDECSYRLKMQEDRNITTRYRGDYHHICPQCGSTNIKEGYGKFTKILVSRDNLINSAQVSSNKDNLINCFKVKGGDEFFDAAVVNQNPNGSDYFYQFSDENMVEMPPALVQKIQDYQNEYNLWYQGDSTSGKGIYDFTTTEVNQINELIAFCKDTFNKETVQDFIELKPRYTGYQSLASQFYSLLDLEAFYRDSMVPDLKSSPADSLEQTFANLTVANLSPIAVFDPSTAVLGSVESALIQRVKCIINTSLYTIEVVNSGQDSSYTQSSNKTSNGTWRGKLKLAQIDKVGTKEESEYTKTTSTLTITVNGNMAKYVTQQIEAMVKRKDTSLEDLNAILTQELDYIKQYDQKPPTSLINTFKEKLHEYSLNQLTKIVRPCYSEVLNIVGQQGPKINEIYWDFYNEHLKFMDGDASQGIKGEIPQRTEELAIIQSVLNKVESYRQQTKDALNFADYLGEDLYKVFCNYRREDSYKNDNYISIELDNSVVMRRAGELIDAAQKELYKASHLQFDVSGNLNNLLALPEFAPIKDDFEVGNWIKMSVDDKLYDLRLLSYSINFDELQSINIDFSTVEKIWSGASDIQSVLQSAGSIAGSYSIVQNKVKENDKSSKLVNEWVNDGLKATMTKFANDPIAQEIVYDSTGFYARGYDDSTGEYLPQQLKIVKNGLYITDDNWDKIRTGVGAFTYVDEEGVTQDAYGVIADTVVGRLVLGQNLVIYNEGGTFKVDEDGLHLKNKAGSEVFFADNDGNLDITGSITATNLTATDAGTIGPWKITEKALYKEGGWKSSTAGSAYLGDEGISVTNKFYVDKTGKLTATGADIQGEIKADTGRIGGSNGWTIASNKISNGTLGSNNSMFLGAANLGTATIANKSLSTWRLTVGSGFGVTNEGALYATGATITGSITASGGSITGGLTVSGYLTTNANRTTYNSTSATGITISSDGIGGYGSSTYYFNMTTGGKLTCVGATITGNITASTLTTTGTGKIGPWNFTKTSLYTSTNSLGGSGIYLGSGTSDGDDDGFSVSGNFIVSAEGYLTMKSPDGSAGINIYGSSGSQHTQIHNEFMYIGDSGTARINIRADGIYYQTGSYLGTLNQDVSRAIDFIALRTASGRGTHPTIQIRGYDNTFRTPVGSSSTSTNYCYGLGCRSNEYLYISGAWGGGDNDGTRRVLTVEDSDFRLKKNIEDSSINALSIISQMRSVSFDWKKNNKHETVGFIAQELEMIDPDLVIPPDDDIEEDDVVPYYGINTYHLQNVAIKAIQEQQSEIIELQQEIQSLKNIIKELKGE